jgi:hypothetical protein
MFTLEQRHKILNNLNLALLRTYEIQAQYMDFGGENWHFSAKLNPTEYQANRSQALLFKKEDIFLRLDNIEAETEFNVAAVVLILSQLEDIEITLNQLLSSANYAIKIADVIEFDINKKNEGLEMQRDRLIEKLRYFLNLPPTPSNGGGWNTPLQRS